MLDRHQCRVCSAGVRPLTGTAEQMDARGANRPSGAGGSAAA
jgi:hypothetical protein